MKKIFANCHNMDGTRRYLAKWNKSQTEGDKYHMIYLYVESKKTKNKKQKKQMNKENKTLGQIHRYRECTGSCQRGRG